MSQEQDKKQTTSTDESTVYLDRTRTFCQFRVGKSQVVDVVLHRRPHDDRIARSDVVHLLETSILPRLFADSIEEQHARDTHKPLPPSELGLGGILTTQQQQKKKKAPPQRKKKLTKKERAERLQQQKETERKERKNHKEVYYAISDTLRIAYQLHSAGESTKRSGSATLVRQHNTAAASTNWTALTPVDTSRRRRLELWCYPIDVELPAEHGFLRPTLIPMASLFRQPKEGDDPPAKEKNPSPKKKRRRKQK